LILGFNFNQPVSESCLPNSITHLEFGWCFNHPVANLPSSITHLKFTYGYQLDIENLPLSLEELVIPRNKENLIKIPFNCKVIFI
jgi:hypothetical protein